jgi:hypothetical protein
LTLTRSPPLITKWLAPEVGVSNVQQPINFVMAEKPQAVIGNRQRLDMHHRAAQGFSPFHRLIEHVP